MGTPHILVNKVLYFKLITYLQNIFILITYRSSLHSFQWLCNISLLTWLPSDGNVGCFQLSTTTDNNATNILYKILMIYLNIVIPLNMCGREGLWSLLRKGSSQVNSNLKPTIYGPRTMARGDYWLQIRMLCHLKCPLTSLHAVL